MRTVTALALGGLLWTGCSAETKSPSYDDNQLKAQIKALESSVNALQASLTTVQTALGTQEGALSDARGEIDRLDSTIYLDLGAALPEFTRRAQNLPLQSSLRLPLTTPELASIATVRAAAETVTAVARQPEAAEVLKQNLAVLGKANLSTAAVRGYFIATQFYTVSAIARQPEAAGEIIATSQLPVPEGTQFGTTVAEDVGRAFALAGLFEAIARQPEAKTMLLGAYTFGPITNLRSEEVQLARVEAIGALLDATARQPEADFTEAIALLGTQPVDLDASARWSHGYAVAAASEAMARQPEATATLRGYLATLLHLGEVTGN